MDCTSLLDLSMARLASMVKGKSTVDIRKVLKIKNDYSAEEEAQVREENKWCEDML